MFSQKMKDVAQRDINKDGLTSYVISYTWLWRKYLLSVTQPFMFWFMEGNHQTDQCD